MLFNSFDFAVFLPIVFTLYWFVLAKNLKAQNLLILLSSYFFYGWWDWRFLSLIIISSLIDYLVGIYMYRSQNQGTRKGLLLLSLLVNLGFLGFFKYYNFFLSNFIDAFSFFGMPIKANFLNVILPVGISFYTFQTLSYSIDIYKRRIEPTTDAIAFFAFVSFFPQLVAGPIERAANLLPQFRVKRIFDLQKASDGMRQILWGLFKKVVIADNCAIYVNDIFANYTEYSAGTLWLGGILFAFQIYGDFSGYSDIAIGTARLFGFNLMQNFAFPYFSRDIAEFWRRWHISLSTWFRDYVYIPLGGSKGGIQRQIINVFIIFIVSGFWHGANWTFIFWGFLNACYFLPLLLSKKNRTHLNIVAAGKILPGGRELLQILVTFLLTTIAWIFFRAENISHAWDYLGGMFSNRWNTPEILPLNLLITLVLFLGIEWIQRDKQHALELGEVFIPRWLKWGIYLTIGVFISMYFGQDNDFIYFQF